VEGVSLLSAMMKTAAFGIALSQSVAAFRPPAVHAAPLLHFSFSPTSMCPYGRGCATMLSGDELDALDTSDSWEAQAEAERLWLENQKEQQKKEQRSEPDEPYRAEWRVDEDAHLGLGDDGDDMELADWRSVRAAERLLAQVPAATNIVGSSEPASTPTPVSTPTRVSTPAQPTGATTAANVDRAAQHKQLMNALGAVIGSLTRLEEQMGKQTEALNRVAAQSSAPPSAASSKPLAEGEWDGVVDESAYFDYDIDDV